VSCNRLCAGMRSLTTPPILKINARPECPHRAPGTRKESPDESVVVVIMEVEERIAVVAVDTEMSAGQDLEANTGMPAEFGRTDVQIAGYASFESNRSEIYVAPFSGQPGVASGKWQVSANGGMQPQLPYRSACAEDQLALLRR
jgi:hypothetical protein